MHISIFLSGVCIILIIGSLAIAVNWCLHNNLKQMWLDLQDINWKNSMHLKASLNEYMKYFFIIGEFEKIMGTSDINKFGENSYLKHDFYAFEDNDNYKKGSFQNFWYYLLRIGLIIILGLILYFISYFLFFANIQSYMMAKIDFADAMLNRRVFVYQRNLFLDEMHAGYPKVGLLISTVFPHYSHRKLVILTWLKKWHYFEKKYSKIQYRL